MSMIKGKIETDREFAPKEISFGRLPIHQNKNGQWISNTPEFDVIESDLGTLIDESSQVESENKKVIEADAKAAEGDTNEERIGEK